MRPWTKRWRFAIAKDLIKKETKRFVEDKIQDSLLDELEDKLPEEFREGAKQLLNLSDDNTTMVDGLVCQHLLAWFEQHGRKDLPWQADINPYRVWVSEIMLQQTQVTTVIGYYQRFMLRFPDVASLATADIDEVLHLWTGLGYYARGRNLHKAAQILVAEHNGELPTDQQQLEMLPGIGRSTAGAIRAISMNQRGVILDGNVKRVLARYHAVEGHYSQASVGKHLWRLAEEHTPKQNIAAYTQGIMDLGATVCLRSRPNCGVCPLSESCQALATDRVAELPTKKKSAPKPVRQARFFIVSSPNQQILLEQRPQSGIWAGFGIHQRGRHTHQRSLFCIAKAFIPKMCCKSGTASRSAIPSVTFIWISSRSM